MPSRFPVLLRNSKKLREAWELEYLRDKFELLIHVLWLSLQRYMLVQGVVALLLLMDIYVPQSYCMSLVSGNWKHTLVAIGWRKSALGESS